MNQNHLDELIRNYIDEFSVINNDDHREYYKWDAVKQFKDAWDIEAADFAAMFKKAISKTENLINNHIVQPANGIVKLAEHEEIAEQVRGLFRALFYTDDNGQISKRQDRIESFVDAINALLEKYEPGKWKYKQEFRSALFYLNLFAPEKNYLYKATQAHAFKQCVECEDDFGSGSSFQLDKYYKLCDWLVANIKANEQLTKLHHDRLTDSMYREDDYHILAFDIIYCAVTYQLYRGIDIFVPTKANNRRRAEEEKIAALQTDLEDLDTSLLDLMQQRASYDDFAVLGFDIEHDIFGAGTVVSQNNGCVVVRFDSAEKKFLVPQSFEKKMLKFKDPEIMNIILEISEIDKRIAEVKRDLSIKSMALKRSLPAEESNE